MALDDVRELNPELNPDLNLELNEVREFLVKGAGRLFPGAVLAFGPLAQKPHLVWVGQRGLTRNQEPVRPDLVYDLASVTKILATTFLTMILLAEGRLATNQVLGDFGWPGAAGQMTLASLLSHASGLPPWRPLYRLKPEPTLRASYQKAIELEAEKPLCPLGDRVIYSDLNFLALGFVLEDLSQMALGQLFAERIQKPLNLATLGFHPGANPLIGSIAPTEDGFRVGGPLAYPGAPILGPTPLGRPHDDNAAALGGAAGHAGLFGSAQEIWTVLSHWSLVLNNHAGLVNLETLKTFLEPQKVKYGQPRALGFDLGQEDMAGLWGHWGYTGGGVWWDPVRDWGLVFLTNRVHPTARREGLGPFRRELIGLARSFLAP
ncbi:MAG: beta-lactamase family protein [Deltaproteobacteria bacterium]|jgi:CubicO group peptidase (beta-lactamase class C family)|nr:beta-lactamase family protein [Deltaproteobacteria bacterium]